MNKMKEISICATILLLISQGTSDLLEIVPKSATRNIGDDVAMVCLTDIENYYEIRWLKNKVTLPLNELRYNWMQQRRVMIIKKIALDDAGLYFCQILYSYNQPLLTISTSTASAVTVIDTVEDICLGFHECTSSISQSIHMTYYDLYDYKAVDFYVCSEEQAMYFSCKNPMLILLGKYNPCIRSDGLGYVSCGTYAQCVPTYLSTYQCSCRKPTGDPDGHHGKYCNLKIKSSEHMVTLQINNKQNDIAENLRYLRDVIANLLKYKCFEEFCKFNVLQGSNPIFPWKNLDSRSVFIESKSSFCPQTYTVQISVVQTLSDYNIIAYLRTDINLLLRTNSEKLQSGNFTTVFPEDNTGEFISNWNPCLKILPVFQETTSYPIPQNSIDSQQNHIQINAVLVTTLAIASMFVVAIATYFILRKLKRNRTQQTLEVPSNHESVLYTNQQVLAGNDAPIASISFKDIIKFIQPPPYTVTDQNKHMAPPRYHEIQNENNCVNNITQSNTLQEQAI